MTWRAIENDLGDKPDLGVVQPGVCASRRSLLPVHVVPGAWCVHVAVAGS
jgi:hypothetical protein